MIILKKITKGFKVLFYIPLLIFGIFEFLLILLMCKTTQHIFIDIVNLLMNNHLSTFNYISRYFSVIELIMTNIILYFLIIGIYRLFLDPFISERGNFFYSSEKNVIIGKFKDNLSTPFLLAICSTIVVILLNSVIALYSYSSNYDGSSVDFYKIVFLGVTTIAISIVLLVIGKFMQMENNIIDNE